MLHSEDSELYTDNEKAVIAYAKELAETANVSDQTFDRLKRYFPDRDALVEVHMAAALPNITNRVNNPFLTDLEPGVKAFKPS